MRVRFFIAKTFCSFWRFSELRLVSTFLTSSKPLVLVRSFAGSKLVLNVSRSTLHKLIFLSGERALPERFLLSEIMRPGMHIVDVGANIGYYLAFEIRATGDDGWVTCIEPSPENLEELRANVKRNNWKNLLIQPCAVGETDSQIGLRAGINSGVVSLEEGVFTAPMHPLDTLIDRKCDFLKIDVDGYELHVLRGAAKTIARDRPLIFLEYHPELVPAHGGSFFEVMEFLQTYYSSIKFFDVPDSQTLAEKIGTRYFGKDPVRQIDVSGIPEEDLHLGRLYGTFWVICYR